MSVRILAIATASSRKRRVWSTALREMSRRALGPYALAVLLAIERHREHDAIARRRAGRGVAAMLALLFR